MERLERINVEAEIRKKRDVEYWPNYEEFISKFPGLDNVDEEYLDQTKRLLYSFRHVFYNPDRPDQFHRGINMKPVVIDRIKGMKPKKEKV